MQQIVAPLIFPLDTVLACKGVFFFPSTAQGASEGAALWPGGPVLRLVLIAGRARA